MEQGGVRDGAMSEQEHSRRMVEYDTGMDSSLSSAKSQGTTSLTYSVSEAANTLGVTPATIYRLLNRHLLKAVPGLRHKRISKKQVESLAEGRVR
jgi:excisionase family DNA binding protein